MQARDVPFCPRCEYDLRGTVDDRCPECGLATGDLVAVARACTSSPRVAAALLAALALSLLGVLAAWLLARDGRLVLGTMMLVLGACRIYVAHAMSRRPTVRLALRPDALECFGAQRWTRPWAEIRRCATRRVGRGLAVRLERQRLVIDAGPAEADRLAELLARRGDAPLGSGPRRS